ncbi:MAG: methyltransferase [Kofleriaceae bacterium]
MDVFGYSVTEAGAALRDAAIAAGYELALFDGRARTLDQIADANAIGKGRRRLRALLDVLVALGALRRDGEAVSAAAPPAKPEVARAGWGAMVDVFRSDQALAVEGGEVERRYHHYLTVAGKDAAAELAPLLAGATLVDLGCGAGTYTAAYLDRFGDARATAIDFWDVVPLAKAYLARFGERATMLGDEISTVQGREVYDVALLANVLHLHAPVFCAKYLARAARLVVPGGRVVVKELRIDEDRGGPLASLLFALNMAIFTGGGDVYRSSEVRGWLVEAGLTAIEEHRLASSPDAIVLVAHKPRGVAAIFGEVTGLDAAELAAKLPADAPAQLRAFASHAMAAEPELAEAIRMHYALEMPRQRAAQLANGGAPLLHHPLAWHRLPRMRAAIERLFAVLHDHGVANGVLGFATPRALFGDAPSLARLYERTHFGGAMPLLYGAPADLACFERRGLELGLDRDGVIDRYLTAPVLHELCHFGRERDALPPHLDECIAGWLAVYVWPEFAYPAAGYDDAIYAAPWLAQVGQAFARAFGVAAIVRAQSGELPWEAALGPAVVEELVRAAWTDWRARRTLHFLADTFDPDPWVALALERGVPDDPAFDRRIVADALRAMCLATELVGDPASPSGGSSFRTRSRVPAGPIHVDAIAAQIATAPRGDHDPVAPRYWLPPAIAAAIRARGHAGYELFLGGIAAIPGAVAALCDGERGEGFTLAPEQIGDTGAS